MGRQVLLQIFDQNSETVGALGHDIWEPHIHIKDS